MKCIRHLFLTLLFFLTAACSETTEVNYQDKNQEKSRGVSPSEIVIGSHTDLSGPVAIWGVGSINGARMRFEELMLKEAFMEEKSGSCRRYSISNSESNSSSQQTY